MFVAVGLGLFCDQTIAAHGEFEGVDAVFFVSGGVADNDIVAVCVGFDVENEEGARATVCGGVALIDGDAVALICEHGCVVGVGLGVSARQGV